jgi:hypothetical protein
MDANQLIRDRSLAAIGPHLPPRALPFIAELLARTPCQVLPVKSRRTKHGDHRHGEYGGASRITVNVCGNAYQFFITLLHEIAHAITLAEHGAGASPHGREWKNEFRGVLQHALEAKLFPADLETWVSRHSFSPTASSFRDLRLQFALRKYDTLD